MSACLQSLVDQSAFGAWHQNESAKEQQRRCIIDPGKQIEEVHVAVDAAAGAVAVVVGTAAAAVVVGRKEAELMEPVVQIVGGVVGFEVQGHFDGVLVVVVVAGGVVVEGHHCCCRGCCCNCCWSGGVAVVLDFFSQRRRHWCCYVGACESPDFVSCWIGFQLEGKRKQGHHWPSSPLRPLV